MQFSRILCAVDLSDASPAVIAQAAAMASWYGAATTVLHVAPTFDAMLVKPARPAETVQVVYPVPREEVLRALERAVEAAGPAGWKPELAVAEGDPAERLVEETLARGADLLVLGTHGRRGFDRLLLGSVTERVIRRASCPALTVPAHAAVRAAPFGTIVCPVDFSEASLHALGFALALARKAGGRLVVLHVVEWLPDIEPHTHEHFEVPEFRRYLMDTAAARLGALLADETTDGCAVEAQVAAGRAYAEILRVADAASADLLVLGAHGRSGLHRSVFGSTTASVLRSAGCPVLTVRAPA
ncbi:MAG: universal stress protein [Acidobacteriota bacterium]